MPFLKRPSARRRTFLSLIGDIERGLRAAYARRARDDGETQSSLAAKLGVNRSAVHRRLTGRMNLTIETVADMVWALGYGIRVEIFDPAADATRRNCALLPPDPATIPTSTSNPGIIPAIAGLPTPSGSLQIVATS
jgi:transcriptional regulator with XRE-family HTH domain